MSKLKFDDVHNVMVTSRISFTRKLKVCNNRREQCDADKMTRGFVVQIERDIGRM